MTIGEALWLRCRFGRRIERSDCSMSGVGGAAMGRGGEMVEATTSALPSNDMEMRKREGCVLGGGRIEPAGNAGGHDDEKDSRL